ncbi:hypothetical protein EPN16_00935 [bacterium]|nr:MAG: hypothetical protein EPN16_00935 [bacterium]
MPLREADVRRTALLFLIPLFIFYAISGIAKEDKKEEIPAGMEIIRIGDGQRLYLPKGTKTKRVGAQLILEDNSEYVAKRFSEMEIDIKALQAKIEAQEIEIEQLKKIINEIQNSQLISKENEKP